MVDGLKTAASNARSLGVDAKTAAAIAGLRARIAERATGILEDLEAIHLVIEEARPLTHTVEAFEALEDLDTQAWEALDVLRAVLTRGVLAGQPAEEA